MLLVRLEIDLEAKKSLLLKVLDIVPLLKYVGKFLRKSLDSYDRTW